MMGNVEESEHYHRYTIETHATRTIRLENSFSPKYNTSNIRTQMAGAYASNVR